MGADNATLHAQQKALRRIIASRKGCSVFAHLGLDRLGNVADADQFITSFQRAVSVQSLQIFLDSLGKMLPQSHLPPLQVLQSANLVVRGVPVAAVPFRNVPVPVVQADADEHRVIERMLFSKMRQNGIPLSGGWFYITEPEFTKREITINQQNISLSVPLQGWHMCVASGRSPWAEMLSGPRIFPRAAHMPQGGSRWQWFNALRDELAANSRKIDVLVAHPRTLIDFCLYVSQQSGRFVGLEELVPNLKLIVLTHYDVGMPRTEISYLMAKLPHVRWVQWVYQPNGLQMWQADANIRQRLVMHTSGPTFYEFVPVAEIDAAGRFNRNHKRLHVGQIEHGQEYVVITSTLGGLLAVNTGQIVKVLNTDPLHVMAMGPLVQLNGLGEGLREDAVLQAIGNINGALQGHGVFIREALLGHVVAERQPFWVVEVSRPLAEIAPGVPESMVKRLHAELELRSTAYRNAFRASTLRPPKVHIVPMGTFSATSAHIDEFTQFDHSPDASQCKKVLAGAWEVKMIEAV